MNYDEFAFFNQQLAAMLKDGLPLEGALRQIARQMRRGSLRDEIDALAKALEQGAPLGVALAGRRFPPLYARMVTVGAQTNDFPGMLTLLADYYQNLSGIWMRLRALMVYPAILLVLLLGLSIWFGVLHTKSLPRTQMSDYSIFWPRNSTLPPPTRLEARMEAALWSPPVLLALTALPGLALLLNPSLRRRLSWRVSPFREACLAQFAAGMALLLRGGSSLRDALALLDDLESSRSAKKELQKWRARHEQGETRAINLAGQNSLFPPLFLWLVESGGQDLPAGFERAAKTYLARSRQRTEVLLNAALPVALLFVGLLILGQVYPFATSMFTYLKGFGL